jgi:predicted MPP superfamily phosphohydrolase
MSRTLWQRLEMSPAFWDGAIGALILAGIALIYVGGIRDLPSLSLFGVLGVLVLLWGSLVEPRLLKTTRIRIALPVSKPLRVAFASDMHVGPYKKARHMERLVRRILALEPDIILLGGDYLFDHGSGTDALLPFAQLRAPLGVFAVIGNHDAGHFWKLNGEGYALTDRSAEIASLFTSLGIVFLRNEHRVIEHGGGQLAIAGIDDLWNGNGSATAMSGIPDGMPTILLAHEPDTILDRASGRADLILSGHTHGGQIRLPLLGPVPPLPQKLGRKFDQGLFKRENGKRLFISHGCGESGVRARLFCVPEVVMLEIDRR